MYFCSNHLALRLCVLCLLTLFFIVFYVCSDIVDREYETRAVFDSQQKDLFNKRFDFSATVTEDMLKVCFRLDSRFVLSCLRFYSYICHHALMCLSLAFTTAWLCC